MDKLMFFFIEDNNLLGKYNTIQDNLSADIKEKKLIAGLSRIKLF